MLINVKYTVFYILNTQIRVLYLFSCLMFLKVVAIDDSHEIFLMKKPLKQTITNNTSAAKLSLFMEMLQSSAGFCYSKILIVLLRALEYLY